MAKQTFTTGQVLTAAQMTSLQQTAMLGGDTTAKTASYVLVAADAGTTVAMDAAGATTITVNTGLFAAGDTVFIQNRGAGVCTVTAGTATVASAGSLALPQNDAGILYFTSASAATFYDFIQVGGTSPLTTKGDLYTFSTSDARLPVGSNDQILVADSSTSTGLKWATQNAVGCAVYSTATQSLTNNTLTALTFDAETYDTNAFHSTSTNTSRITIPAGYGGKYRIGGLVSFHPNATGRRELQLYKNGAVISYGNTVIGNGSEFIGTYMDWTTTLVAGDYVELYALQSSGGSLTVYTTILNCQFSVDWLGA